MAVDFDEKKMLEGLLLANTTKEERQEIVNSGYAVAQLDGGLPPKSVRDLFQQYVDGEIEFYEAEKKMKELFVGGKYIGEV